MATLTKFTDQNGVNWDAAREQMALSIALLYQDAARFVRILKLGGNSPSFTFFQFTDFDNKDSPWHLIPSFCVWEQQGEYWINVFGTQTRGQWIGNLSGVFQSNDFNGTATTAHAFHAIISQAIWILARQKLPASMDGKTLNIFGHSLGASCAHAIGCYAKKDLAGVKVNVLTCGEPKLLVKGYTGTRPDTHNRIVHNADIVTFLPTAPTQFGANYWNPFDEGFAQLLEWEHYGHPTYLSSDGELHDDPPSGFSRLLPSDLSASNFTDHSPINYYRAAAERYDTKGGLSTTGDLTSIVNELVNSGTVARNIVQENQGLFLNPAVTNQNLYGTPNGPMTQENWSGFDIVGGSAAKPYAPAFKQTGSSGMANWKVDQVFKWGAQSWKETVWMLSKGDTPNAQDPAVVELYTQRSRLLSAAVVFDRVTLTNVADKNRTDSVLISRLGKLTEVDNPPNGSFKNAHCITLRDIDGWYSARLYMRGWPAESIPADVSNRPRQDPFNYAARLAAYRDILAGNGPLKQKYGIHAVDKAAGVPFLQVEQVIKDTVSRQFTVIVDPSITLPVGTRVKLTGNKGWGIRGLNKPHTIADILAPGTYLLHGESCDGCAVDLKVPGKLVILTKPGFIEATFCGDGFWTTHKIGRPAHIPRGRNRRACCR